MVVKPYVTLIKLLLQTSQLSPMPCVVFNSNMILSISSALESKLSFAYIRINVFASQDLYENC